MKSELPTLGVAACLLLVWGCNATGLEILDSGRAPDSGTPLDTGALTDTGSAPDTGPVDTGAADTGVVADAGPPDTGAVRGPRHFPPDAIWYSDISQSRVDPASADILEALAASGFGLGRAQIDFSLVVLYAEPDTLRREFLPTKDFFEPDCDHVAVPIPEMGAIEGQDGYECVGGGDCHLIVVDLGTRELFEMWRANIAGRSFLGGCLAVWDTTRVYPETGRGEQCTSADAAGFPIAPLLFTSEEVASGDIGHALRFILPNDRIRAGEYVRPATHGTSATTGDLNTLPYGARLRLRADFDLSTLPNDGARTVARALQRYGMFLSDGGSVLLTAASDRFSNTKWEGLLGSRDLGALQVADFDVMPLVSPVPLTFDCVRN